jgi:hypothetical protein
MCQLTHSYRKMSSNDYRIKAAEFRARATREASESLRAELFALAKAYLRLAEQADRNSHSDVSYEPSAARSNDRNPRQ